MAKEIQINLGRTGRSLYVNIRNVTSGYIWNLSGPSFEPFTPANFANYAVGMTEDGSTGYYTASFPQAIPNGVHDIAAKDQVGGTPAQSDPAVGGGELVWNGGFGVYDPGVTAASIGQILAFTPIRMARSYAVSGFPFKLVSSADHVTPFTSGVVSGQIMRDGGNFGPLQSGAFTEKGLGWYAVNLTSGDLTAGTVALVFTANGVSGGGADQRDLGIVLQPLGR